ncbi:MAG: Ig-like domain-containing protein, partial [Rhodoferax sp.]|nr:Ig-like domain-containing protein [Rhodoferax sp.]
MNKSKSRLPTKAGLGLVPADAAPATLAPGMAAAPVDADKAGIQQTLIKPAPKKPDKPGTDDQQGSSAPEDGKTQSDRQSSQNNDSAQSTDQGMSRASLTDKALSSENSTAADSALSEGSLPSSKYSTSELDSIRLGSNSLHSAPGYTPSVLLTQAAGTANNTIAPENSPLANYNAVDGANATDIPVAPAAAPIPGVAEAAAATTTATSLPSLGVGIWAGAGASVAGALALGGGNDSTAAGPTPTQPEPVVTSITVDIHSNKSPLKTGDTANITFTFSADPGNTFDAADFSVTGGTLGTLSGSGLTRTALFTPTPGMDSSTASIRIKTDPSTTAGGTATNALTGSSPSISFDTKAPALSITSDLSALKA